MRACTQLGLGTNTRKGIVSVIADNGMTMRTSTLEFNTIPPSPITTDSQTESASDLVSFLDALKKVQVEQQSNSVLLNLMIQVIAAFKERNSEQLKRLCTERCLSQCALSIEKLSRVDPEGEPNAQRSQACTVRCS
jgi:hypothetical protein